MKLIDIISHINDNDTAIVFQECQEVARYDGKDSIDEQYNECEVSNFFTEDHICFIFLASANSETAKGVRIVAGWEMVKALTEYFTEYPEEFNDAIEALNDFTGVLENHVRTEMSWFNDSYCELQPLDLAERIAYGKDDDGEDHFIPTRRYFYEDGFGDIHSTDTVDYSDFFTEPNVAEYVKYVLAGKINPYNEDIESIIAGKED